MSEPVARLDVYLDSIQALDPLADYRPDWRSRPAEVRVAEIRPGEVSPSEVRLAEVPVAEAWLAEIRLAEVRLGFVALRVGGHHDGADSSVQLELGGSRALDVVLPPRLRLRRDHGRDRTPS